MLILSITIEITKGKQLEMQLTRVNGRRVRVDFKDGEVTSDTGCF